MLWQTCIDYPLVAFNLVPILFGSTSCRMVFWCLCCVAVFTQLVYVNLVLWFTCFSVLIVVVKIGLGCVGKLTSTTLSLHLIWCPSSSDPLPAVRANLNLVTTFAMMFVCRNNCCMVFRCFASR